MLCDDDRICGVNRYLSAGNYATVKCIEFSELIPQIDAQEKGIQAMHEAERLWVSCAIFCRRRDVRVYYSPRLELNDLGSRHSAYFPDGTFCHNDGVQNYYCLHNHCLPESFKFTKSDNPGHSRYFEDDVPFWVGNALPGEDDDGDEHGISEMLMEYMSLDEQRLKPIRTKLNYGNVRLRTPPREWEFGENDLVERDGGFYFE